MEPWEMWGGVRKAVKVMGTVGSRAAATLASLLHDIKGMACLVRSRGLDKQCVDWRYRVVSRER